MEEARAASQAGVEERARLARLAESAAAWEERAMAAESQIEELQRELGSVRAASAGEGEARTKWEAEVGAVRGASAD